MKNLVFDVNVILELWLHRVSEEGLLRMQESRPQCIILYRYIYNQPLQGMDMLRVISQ